MQETVERANETQDLFKPVADSLFAYLHDIIYSPSTALLDIETLPESFHEFGKGLQYVNLLICQAKAFAKEVSTGNLDCEPPPSYNEIVSALKSLHASLKHLAWQTQQVAKGDYSQNVKFMGDFSAAFNEMIKQLDEQRRIIAEEQAKLTDELIITERLCLIDPLTGIANRRSFDARLCLEWNKAVRKSTSISILMMDIDKFKNLNDTYGHQQGDIFLKLIAEVFQHSLSRPGDFPARWGGEEFAALLPNTPLAGAMEVAEKIRSTIEKMVIPYSDSSPIKTTISIGVNSLVPEKNSSLDEFISNADKALYAAKDRGRNRIVSASES